MIKIDTTISTTRLVDWYRLVCARIRADVPGDLVATRTGLTQELITRGLGDLADALLVEHLAQVAINGHFATELDRELLHTARNVIRTALAVNEGES